MLHLLSLNRNNGGKLIYFSFFIITTLLLSSISALGDDKIDQEEKNIISKVTAKAIGNDLELRIQCSLTPTYTIYELYKPSRIVVDIANAEVNDLQKLTLPSNYGIDLTTAFIKNVTPNLTRIEFILPQSYSFNTSKNDNDITITLAAYIKNGKPAVQTSGTTPSTASQKQKKSNKGNQSIESQLPKVDPMKPAGSKAVDGDEKTSVATMEDNFNFSGYNKERITVDFYKIDLHNVFRLLREVSGVNIVVDESVSGSLTLALNDVPWDFALDIIVNLKDLTKEERFNTIVIHPKDKEFSWPERAEDNLSFEADEVQVQEALIIQQQENIPPEVVEAKKIIVQGRKAEKRGNAETAVQLYETALKKWPKNSRLANKIAAIYLVHLRQNAKAVFFANKALAVDNTNSSAALNAAIAYANMQENVQAQQYFDQSISGIGKPTSEALLSYAAFSEDQKRYDAAVKLLQKHDDLYGKSFNSMVARARILDKMGEHKAATDAYRAILLGGFQVPPDLKKFIIGRTSLSQSM